MSPAAVAIIATASLFAFLNGAKDGANALATIVTSRSMAPASAVFVVVTAQFLGPFIFGVAVAYTVGSGIADASAITATVVLAALVSANLWNVTMWWLRIPTSSSHALIGGIVGSVLVANAFDFGLLKLPGLVKVAVGLFMAPVLGLMIGYAIMALARFFLGNAPPRINWFFKRGQFFTTVGLALSFGANDAPKSMGMMTMGLVALGLLPAFVVPQWVVVLSAASLALGTLLGGWRMVRTIGTRFYRVRPIHAFNSQFSSAGIVIGASLVGAPASTSQVVSSSIVGVGAAERLTRVRWGVLGEILTGWVLTIPASVALGGLVYLVLASWFGQA